MVWGTTHELAQPSGEHGGDHVGDHGGDHASEHGVGGGESPLVMSIINMFFHVFFVAIMLIL